MTKELCPCGSGLALKECCGQYLEGTQQPPHAEALLRARFSAFCLEQYAYILETTHPDFRDDMTEDTVRENSKGVRPLRLDVRESGTAPARDGSGEAFETVTFIAMYDVKDRPYQFAETAYFRREGDTLYYVEGMRHRPLGYRRAMSKVGRNEPCPCGSGKKYKKCCGTQAEAAS